MPITGKVDGAQDGNIRGWAWKSDAPAAQLAVLFCHRGKVVARATASQFRGDLFQAGIAGGAHAFSVTLPQEFFDGQAASIEVFALWQKKKHPLPGSPVTFQAEPADYARAQTVGSCEDVQGPFLRGWATRRDQPERPAEISAWVEGERVAQCQADLFRADVRKRQIHPTGFCGFKLRLPEAVVLEAKALHVYAGEAELRHSPVDLAPAAETLRELLQMEEGWRSLPPPAAENEASLAPPNWPGLAAPSVESALAVLTGRLAGGAAEWTPATLREWLLLHQQAGSLLERELEALPEEFRWLAELVAASRSEDANALRQRVLDHLLTGKLEPHLAHTALFFLAQAHPKLANDCWEALLNQ